MGAGGIIAIIVGVLIIGVIVAILLYKKNSTSSLTDEVTGLGNLKYMSGFYKKASKLFNGRDFLALIGFDAAIITGQNGLHKSTLYEKEVANVLKDFCGASGCATRTEAGRYLIYITADSLLVAQQRINDLADSLNHKQVKALSECIAPCYAGISPVNKDTVFDMAVKNTKLAYDYALENDLTSYVCTKELIKSDSYKNHLFEKLSLAIDDGQFLPFIQFIKNVEKGSFTRGEVLSRWNSPSDGFLMPAYYINDMRNTGIIERFDMYMLDNTCRLLSDWTADGFENICLSCNITRTTISSENFLNELKTITKNHKFDHSRLTLEITEDALIDKAIAYKNIVACRQEGFKIAIDDLCAGHSSFEDISNYPVDQVKLDRHIISTATDERGFKLIKELVQMAHNLNMEVVCEGVETKEQCDAVIKCGCDYIQGYYYSYVFPIEEGRDYYLKSLE